MKRFLSSKGSHYQRSQKPSLKGIPLQKKHGQYFLRNPKIVEEMVNKVSVPNNCIFEIGCGDGFLTREIMAHKPQMLWVFEIDPAWAHTVNTEFGSSSHFKMNTANFLDIDFSIFEEKKPWTLLSNLPYHVTFPILYKIHKHRDILKEAVVMVQEEVAQKIVKKGGRGYGYISLFFQHYFNWQLLSKVSPGSFYPEPKVFSRLLYFSPKQNVVPIVEEEGFWKFIKQCFMQPRRTLRNNLMQTHHKFDMLPEETLDLRAQQLSFDQLLTIWKELHQV